MFDNISQYLNNQAQLRLDHSGGVTERDMQIVVAALMVRVASADGVISDGELLAIQTQLKGHFAVDDLVAKQIAEVTNFLSADQSKLSNLILVVVENFTLEQKQVIFSMLWRVMLGDGSISSEESAEARKIGSLLELNSEQLEAAKLLK